MADLASVQATVHGRVQGVSFRAFISRQAMQLGLTGYARNLPSGEAVEVHAEGERKQLEELLIYLKIGPPGAKVEKVEANWSQYTGGCSRFDIRY